MPSIDELRAKQQAQQQRSQQEDGILAQGFQSPFWALIEQELKARKAVASSKVRTFVPKSPEDWPALLAAHCEVGVFEWLLDLPRVLAQQKRIG